MKRNSHPHISLARPDPEAGLLGASGRTVHHVRPEGRAAAQVFLADEIPLHLIVNRRRLAVLMQTPGAERELAAGYLFTEGLIENARDILSLSVDRRDDPGGREAMEARINLTEPDRAQRPRPTDEIWKAASGAPSRVVNPPRSEAATRNDPPRPGPGEPPVFDPAVVWSAWSGLKAHQPLYRLTRGTHAAALFHADGTLWSCHEDVGRHNALDKTIGRALWENWNFDDKFVVLSGRASLEMVNKTAAAGIPLLVCSSSPTAPAVETADRWGLTLIKPDNNRRLETYTQPWRLAED